MGGICSLASSQQRNRVQPDYFARQSAHPWSKATRQIWACRRTLPPWRYASADDLLPPPPPPTVWSSLVVAMHCRRTLPPWRHVLADDLPPPLGFLSAT